MKRILSLGITLLLVFGLFSFPALAADAPVSRVETYREYCEDGSYFIIELQTYTPTARSTGTSGSKTATYCTKGDVAVWAVTVYGTFTYTYGVSAKADTASTTITRYSEDAVSVGKISRVSGASAIGQGIVRYENMEVTKTVTLTCDVYGNLS